MAIGQAYASGYNATRKQQRSLMPAVNTLSNIIADRRRRNAISVRFGPAGPSAEQRSDEFFNRDAEQNAQLQLEEAQRKEQQRYERDQSLLEREEARRQEAHEMQMAQQEQAIGQQAESFDRATGKDDRLQAYEMVKQGLMSRDPKMVNQALSALAPESADVITEGEPVDGARSFKGRKDVPQFIFDPESDYVGVVFPGQEKPTVFKDSQQAFQQVLAPMNPAHEKTKDQIASEKNTSEAQYKRKKLQADVHKDAHNAAMKQFEADGYYQPALFDQKKFDAAYKDYVTKATGEPPAEVPKPTAKEKKARAIPDNIYKGDKPPADFPDARRGKDGGWYVKKGNGWAPILEGKKKMKKSEDPMTSAGVPFRGAGGKTVIRKKAPKPPADYFEH